MLKGFRDLGELCKALLTTMQVLAYKGLEFCP